MEGKYYLVLRKSGFDEQDVAIAAKPPHEDEVIQTPRWGATDCFASTLNQVLIHILYWWSFGWEIDHLIIRRNKRLSESKVPSGTASSRLGGVCEAHSTYTNKSDYNPIQIPRSKHVYIA